LLKEKSIAIIGYLPKRLAKMGIRAFAHWSIDAEIAKFHINKKGVILARTIITIDAVLCIIGAIACGLSHNWTAMSFAITAFIHAAVLAAVLKKKER
jgi:hypothetical protein